MLSVKEVLKGKLVFDLTYTARWKPTVEEYWAVWRHPNLQTKQKTKQKRLGEIKKKSDLIHL